MLLKEVFNAYGALPRRSQYDSAALRPDGTAVLVFPEKDLYIEGKKLVHKSLASEWKGQTNRHVDKTWLSVLQLCCKTGIWLGVQHVVGTTSTFSMRPELRGTLVHWDSELLIVEFERG